MKSAVILLYILTSAISSYGSGQEINFRPGLLIKELKELGYHGINEFHEIAVPVYMEETGIINGKFFRNEGAGNNQRHTIYIGRVNSCRSGGCTANMVDEPAADYEFFDYYILYDDKSRIVSVRIFNYEATHGQEITVKGWLRQFTGYDGSGLLRAGKEIDSISGATVSVYSIVNDVRMKTELLNKLTFRPDF